jgi:hypothetical protein
MARRKPVFWPTDEWQVADANLYSFPPGTNVNQNVVTGETMVRWGVSPPELRARA